MSQTPSPRPAHRCPICKAAVVADSPSFPFCSERCRLIDLGKWVKGDYVISRPLDQSDMDSDEPEHDR